MGTVTIIIGEEYVKENYLNAMIIFGAATPLLFSLIRKQRRAWLVLKTHWMSPESMS